MYWIFLDYIFIEIFLWCSCFSAKDYGLFLSTEDTKEGVWLEPARALDYYILRNTDLLEYKKKLRTLRVRMLDGTIKTLLVDDSQPVVNLMVVICTKIGKRTRTMAFSKMKAKFLKLYYHYHTRLDTVRFEGIPLVSEQESAETNE